MSAEPVQPTKGTDQLRATLASMPQEQREAFWYDNVYRPDAPQLTVRAVLMGAIVGGVMSVANLYVGLKTGFSFGATFTAGIVAFAFFKVLEAVLPGGEYSDLENNATQTVASAAGFMASAGLVTAIPALLLMDQPMLPAWKLAVWLTAVSLLGVLTAVPLKRQMINLEQVDAQHLALIVEDNGVGIPADELQRIFERFYRADASRTRATGGFGLGLAIVHDLVTAMGGSITVTSTVGKGSRFCVLLRKSAAKMPSSVRAAI